jgi:ABC-2 type transport system permease protein
MNTKKVIAQAKREYWENKVGFVYAPLGVMATFILAFIAMVFFIALNADEQALTAGDDLECENLDCARHLSKLSAYLIKNPESFDSTVLNIMYTNGALVSVALVLVAVAFLHRCLFDDRKEREILFWRSMPVSETMNVLVKLALVVVAIPFIIMLINIVFSLLIIVIGLVFLAFVGVPLGQLVGSLLSAGHYNVPFIVFYENIYWMLLLMPVIGYLLLASAYAKKSPFLTASLVPILLLLLDYMLGKYLGITLGLSALLRRYLMVLSDASAAAALGKLLVVNGEMLRAWLASIAIGSVFVAVAIWLRNNRYEI